MTIKSLKYKIFDLDDALPYLEKINHNIIFSLKSNTPKVEDVVKYKNVYFSLKDMELIQMTLETLILYLTRLKLTSLTNDKEVAERIIMKFKTHNELSLYHLAVKIIKVSNDLMLLRKIIIDFSKIYNLDKKMIVDDFNKLISIKKTYLSSLFELIINYSLVLKQM